MSLDANPSRPTSPTRVTRLGIGGSQIGSMFEPVDDDQAHQTLAAAYDAGIRYFDTSPYYGRGLSEERFGRFLRERPREEFVLSTKVGRVLFPAAGPLSPGHGTVGALPNEFRFDYSYDGVMQSHEDSLRRMGMERIDWLLVHDLDTVTHPDAASFERHFAELVGGGFRALSELRASGRIRGVGAGLNEAGLMRRFLDHFDLDMVLLALSYNLLDRQAQAEDLPLCAAAGVDVVIGAPFSSGVLASGSRSGGTYKYGAVGDDVRTRVRRIEAACARYEVPLRAAALQFPLRHEGVRSVLPGMLSSGQVVDTVAMLRWPIPEAFWGQV